MISIVVPVIDFALFDSYSLSGYRFIKLVSQLELDQRLSSRMWYMWLYESIITIEGFACYKLPKVIQPNQLMGSPNVIPLSANSRQCRFEYLNMQSCIGGVING